MTEREYLVLEIHRERVAGAENFEQFKEIQLLLLDWMLAGYKRRETVEAEIDNNFMRPE